MTDENNWTLDPDLFESDASLGQMVRYAEAGIAQQHSELNAQEVCEGCGALVIVGELASGQLVALDPLQQTFVLYWRQKSQKRGAGRYPTLTESRGYPQHRCSHG